MVTITQFPESIMTISELREYKSLVHEVHKNKTFIALDFTNPDHVRLNDLSGKYVQLIKWLREDSDRRRLN